MKEPAKEIVSMSAEDDSSPECDCDRAASRPQLRPRGIVWLELMTSELEDEEFQDGESQNRKGERA